MLRIALVGLGIATLLLVPAGLYWWRSSSTNCPEEQKNEQGECTQSLGHRTRNFWGSLRNTDHPRTVDNSGTSPGK